MQKAVFSESSSTKNSTEGVKGQCSNREGERNVVLERGWFANW